MSSKAGTWKFNDMNLNPEFDRRHILHMGTGLAAFGLIPRLASAAGAPDPRLLLVNLRGGLDGISAVMPVGDPDYMRLRSSFFSDVKSKGMPLDLDGFFALNPELKTLHRLFRKRQAIIAHATATPYRKRSHFDAQEVLESGFPAAIKADSGWMNRAISGLQTEGQISHNLGLSVGHAIPLIMRGPAKVLSWAPQILPQSSGDTIDRLMQLYQARDPELATALKMGAQLDAMAPERISRKSMRGRGNLKALEQVAKGAAKLLVRSDGARIATASIDGWDTHANEKPGTGRLARLFRALDKLVATLEQELEPVWNDTVVAVVTEFGRTVNVNGTAGTDHGTGGVAFLIGGSIKGGRVIADWPGLRERELFEGRDLRPTTDLRALIKPVLTDHLGLSARFVENDVFPESSSIKALQNIILS
ncbi:MAG: DUF1501 domain-containing protein [Methyloligellaceae bacterium]